MFAAGGFGMGAWFGDPVELLVAGSEDEGAGFAVVPVVGHADGGQILAVVPGLDPVEFVAEAQRDVVEPVPRPQPQLHAGLHGLAEIPDEFVGLVRGLIHEVAAEQPHAGEGPGGELVAVLLHPQPGGLALAERLRLGVVAAGAAAPASRDVDFQRVMGGVQL